MHTMFLLLQVLRMLIKFVVNYHFINEYSKIHFFKQCSEQSSGYDNFGYTLHNTVIIHSCLKCDSVWRNPADDKILFFVFIFAKPSLWPEHAVHHVLSLVT